MSVKWLTSFHDGDLHIAGGDGTGTPNVPMRCAAWQVVDLYPLWRYGSRVHDNRLLPASGVGDPIVVPYAPELVTTKFSLRMVIRGDVMFDYADPYIGDLSSDPWVGYQTNLEYLIDNVVAPTGTETGTRAAALDMPNGDQRTAALHVFDIIDGQMIRGLVKATLEIEIPAGRFT